MKHNQHGWAVKQGSVRLDGSAGELSRADKPLIFVCCGLHSSGSTWLFNLAREICRTQGVEFESCHRESKAKLPDAFGTRLIVVKSHTPMDDLRALIASSSEPAVITVRDPRDAIVSYMQRFGKSFDEAIKTVAISAERLLTLAHQRTIPVFRYEEGFIGRVETFDCVAAMLGTSPSADHRDAILAELTREGVKRTIGDLTTAGIIRPNENAHDPKTLWHANHVGDGRVGKFKDILSPAQLREIGRRTSEFCAYFGYDWTGANQERFSNFDTISADETKSAIPTDGRETVTDTSPAANLQSSSAVAVPQVRKIGLCMIVKNESKVISKCLTSVLPLVDYILVVDTGSTDGTQQIIRDFLVNHNVRGEVIKEAWRDFAYNRSFALERLREIKDVDYALIMDADDIMVLDVGFDPRAFKAQMEHASYNVKVIHGGVTHFRAHICSNRQPFLYKGVLHEYLDVPPNNLTCGDAKGFSIHANVNADGARSQNPRKYQDDAAVLERALATETDPFLISRYTFYLAQSYKDCGEREKALANYLKRAELGYWIEEIYVALLEAGNLMAALNRPFDEVLATFERAYQTVPSRAEALHAASHYCRMLGKNTEGYEFARRRIDPTPPESALFLQNWIYDYGFLDEIAINAYWAGAYRESLDACLKLLGSDKLPPSMVKRIADNARFAAEKLPKDKAPDLGTFGAESMIDQHKLVPQRALRSRVNGAPRVLLAILAKQKEPVLPLYLECIDALDYPKSSIVLYIRTNNNTDKTEQILREWVARVGHLYAAVEFDGSDVTDRVEQYREHEWNATRFKVLSQIRNASLRRALDLECNFYFVADVDNFIRPATLRELVALDLPIVAPLLRSIIPERFYSNYHAEIDTAGYYKNCDQYYWILNRHVRGIVEVPLVHCTYLVRADTIPELTYEEDSGRYEYVIFSESARKVGIPQYLDNRQVYGYITFGEGDHHLTDGIERARALLLAERSGNDIGMESNEVLVHALPNLPPPEVIISGENPEHPLAKLVKNSYDQALAGRGKLDKRLLSFRGASGRKYRLFINTLIGSLNDARYLEVGSYTGSTLCATISGNKVTALIIDNWSLFGGPVKDFMHNVATFRGPATRLSVLESDFRSVDYRHIGKFNVYMFDGPHSERDHYDAVNLTLSALDDTFVLLVDDWDWGQVRSGTFNAIRDNGLKVDLSIEIRTTLDGTTPKIGAERSDWHNGYLLAVISGNTRKQ